MSPASGATATSTPAKTQGKPAAPRRKRGEGQWALGYREPLNKNEENKKFDDGLNVRQRIIDIYAKQGFDSIDPADLRGRFRWYGLYTQRRPGIDGGKTAILEPEELDLRCEWVPRDAFEEMIADRRIVDDSTLAAYTLLLLAERRGDVDIS